MNPDVKTRTGGNEASVYDNEQLWTEVQRLREAVAKMRPPMSMVPRQGLTAMEEGV